MAYANADKTKYVTKKGTSCIRHILYKVTFLVSPSNEEETKKGECAL
jgi:hypothetical protein